MGSVAAASTSVWMSNGLLETAPLDADTRADVCIVGAGVAGLLTADRLSKLGKSVVMIDSGPVTGGETCRTTAHLSNAIDDRYTEVEKLHGAEGLRLAAESHTRAIDHIEDVAREIGSDCEFQRLDGFLVVNDDHEDDEEELLQKEMEASHRAGLTDVERVQVLPPGWPGEWRAALRYPRQGQIDPTRFLTDLARSLMARGVRIHTGTHATHIEGGANAHVVSQRGPTVHAGAIVVATNTPVNDRVAIHTKQAGYQTYVVALRVPTGAISPALFWDGLWKSDHAYHYVRLQHGRAARGEGDLLIVGGEDHKTGQADDMPARYQRLEAWARARFPMCQGVEYRWSGEVMEPVDAVAFIGRNPMDSDNVLIATGDSGNGMTHGAIAGILLSDLIAGRDNPWAKLYDPSRKPGLAALGDYARENLNTAAQYGDWLRAGTAPTEDQIPTTSGAIISHGLKKIAVYKDEHGRCTRLNATCTHLGGVVRWNREEKTWDCPCHASRFDRYGKVIHGPAPTDLKPADEPKKE